jgi:hypothetical protein
MHVADTHRLSEVLRRYAVYDVTYRAVGAIEILRTATECSIACTSASVQIYEPLVGPICDIYWIMCEPSGRSPAETWREYAVRTNEEIENWFKKIWDTTDWRQLVSYVGESTPYPQAMAQGADPRQWVLLEMFFETQNGLLGPGDR